MSAEEEGNSNPLENRRRTRSTSRALSNGGGEEEGANPPPGLELVELPEEHMDNEEEEEENHDNDDASTTQDEEDADDEDDGEEEDNKEEEEEAEAAPAIPSMVTDDDEVANLHEVSQVLKVWEERLAADPNSAAANDTDNPQRHNFNPVPILTRLSEIIEYEALEYLKLDPDPFDDRHPSRTHADCKLGSSLKSLFKKEAFLNKLVGLYCKEGWGEDLDLAVNTTACRLFINVLPGLETSHIFQDSVPMVQRLYQWAEFAPEPLQSYSLGLLGGAMEISDIATKFREKNAHLVPVMLRRLKSLQQEFYSSTQRPFAHLGNSNTPETNHHNGKTSNHPTTPKPQILVNGDNLDGHPHHKDHQITESTLVANGKPKTGTPNKVCKSISQEHTGVGTPTFAEHNNGGTIIASSTTASKTLTCPTVNGGNNTSTTPVRAKRARQAGLTPLGRSFLEPSYSKNTPKRRKMSMSTSMPLDDCSSTSSSWAEMEPNIIGLWQVFPANLVTRQIFILRYVTALGEYQEMLSYAFENSAVNLILRYLSKSHSNSRETSRLTFEALKYLGSLLCHKKFAMEFLQAGGLQRLLQVPRPSLSATGVSLCLYYIAYCEDAMEKVCLASKSTLHNLISYATWLLECSHNSGRNHALMFFSVIYPFKTMLDLFDSQDGLRSVLNVISTQPNFASVIRTIQQVSLPPGQQQDDMDFDLSEEEELMAKQNVRQVSCNLKRYFECHLYFTADKLKRTIGRTQHHTPQVIGPATPPYKAVKIPTNFTDLAMLHSMVQSLLPVTNVYRWAPVERFLGQYGIHIIMHTVGQAFEWSYSGRTETVKNMLDVLSICCLIPRAQLMLTERFKVALTSGNEHLGMYVVLAGAEGEIINETEVKKSALQVIGNCVSGPLSHKKPTDTQIKLWECARINNGILTLTRLLLTKVPLTDADSIRASACWCLSGLARYKHVRQVLQQLPIIRSGLIQNLISEPILQEKRQDHVMFQKYALEIMKLVHGKDEHFSLELGDLIRKTDLISQTRISYDGKQLMELIMNHLQNEGLLETADKLREELAAKSSGGSLNMLMGKSNFRSSSLPIIPSGPSTPTAIAMIPAPLSTTSAAATLPPAIASPSVSIISSVTTQVQQTSFCCSPSPSPHQSQQQLSQPQPQKQVSLDKIVKEYLLSQHALCKTPMVTCPQFDLFTPHKCPGKMDFNSVFKTKTSSNNFASRMLKRELFGYGGMSHAQNDRRLIYSKYKPCRVIRSADLTEEISFTSCAFSPCYQWTIVGTNSGDVKLFNNSNSVEDGTYSCHDSEVYHIQPNSKGSILLTSSIWRRPLSAVWRMEGLFDKIMDFERDEYIEFNKWGQDKVVATNMEHASVYDLETKAKILSLHPRASNAYIRNRATFDPFDDIILSDGVLWDFKSGKEIHKFDKLNENLSGVFNPKNGMEIISNTEIWDVRTFHLLKTVRQLDQCYVKFSNDCNTIYGYKVEKDLNSTEREHKRQGDTSFVVLDNCADYASIATIELKRQIADFAVSPNDLQLALIENHQTDDDDDLAIDTCVRYYEVGRSKTDDTGNGLDDEDDLQSDDDDLEEDDDDDDDDDDDNMDATSVLDFQTEDDADDNEEARDGINDLDDLLDAFFPAAADDQNPQIAISDGEGGELVFERHEESDDDSSWTHSDTDDSSSSS